MRLVLSIILATWLLFVACLFGLCFISTHVRAQEAVIGSGVFGGSGIPYVGPGDVVSGATVWWGLRAYNRAYAGSGGNIAILTTIGTGSAGVACIFASNPNGTFGVVANGQGAGCTAGQTYAQWALDATCTGTISGTTLTCTGASTTPHAGSMLSGTGLAPAGVVASYQISSCGTFTGGAGTCTLNATAPTVGTPETITMAYRSLVSNLYDQTGGGNTLGSLSTNRPGLFIPCLGPLPCLVYTGASNVEMHSAAVTLAQPFTGSYVADRQAGTTYEAILSTATSNPVVSGFNNAVNGGVMYAGTIVPLAANDNVVHAFQTAYSGSSSVFNIDGTNTTVNPGTGGYSSNEYMIGNNGASQFFDGIIQEVGVWPSLLSTTQMNNLCHNQFAYWTTGVSC